MPPPDVEPYLVHLRALPFARSVDLAAREVRHGRDVHDAEIRFKAPRATLRLVAEVKRTHLTAETADRMVDLAARTPNLILFAPAVGRDLGERLARAHVNFMDLAGNCYLRIGDRYVARVQGVPPAPRARSDAALRAPGYRVLFALLAEPTLVSGSTRTLAEAAGGVTHVTAGAARKRLIDGRILLQTRRGVRWDPTGRKAAIDMFLAGFAATLLPSLIIGRFRARERDVPRLEADLERKLSGGPGFRWGGGAACQRLTRHFRGDRTVLYLDRRDTSLAATLQLVADPVGPVLLCASPGPLAFKSPDPTTVHPLLAYADLLVEGDERARDGAAEIRRRYLDPVQGPP